MQQPSPEEQQKIAAETQVRKAMLRSQSLLKAVTEQRNNALNLVANLQADIAVLEVEKSVIPHLEATVASLTEGNTKASKRIGELGEALRMEREKVSTAEARVQELEKRVADLEQAASTAPPDAAQDPAPVRKLRTTKPG